MAKQYAWQSLTLPSRGEFYPSSGDVAGANGSLIPDGKISIRRMDFAEESAVASAGIDFIDRLNTIIQNCTKLPCDSKVLSPSNLLITDRMAIVFFCRTLTYGGAYSFTYRCRGCGGTNKKTIDIFKDFEEMTPETVRIKLEEKDPSEALEEPWSLQLPESNHLLQLRFLRGTDEAEIFSRAKRARMQSTNTGDPSATMNMAKQIVTLDGEPPKSTALMEKFVKEDLTAKERAMIRISTDERETGIDTRVYPTCTICGFVNNMNMPWDAEFFQPSSVS